MEAESEDGTRCSSQKMERVDELWFYDGNIVIIVEDKGFRVHKSVLSQHSVVFKEMFETDSLVGSSGLLGCTTSVHDEVDGIPAVLLHGDSATDFYHFLKLLYDWTFLYGTWEISFTVASGLLRIGTKYMAGTVRKTVIQMLKSVYDPRLEKRRIEHFDGEEFAYFNLANELNVKSILPFVYLEFCKHPLELLRERLVDLDAPLIWNLVNGREKIHIHEAQSLVPKIQRSDIADHTYDVGDPRLCRSHALHQVGKHRTNPPEEKPTRWPDDSAYNGNALCMNCYRELRGVILAFRKELRPRLPGFFGMENWTELERLDKESTEF